MEKLRHAKQTAQGTLITETLGVSCLRQADHVSHADLATHAHTFPCIQKKQSTAQRENLVGESCYGRIAGLSALPHFLLYINPLAAAICQKVSKGFKQQTWIIKVSIPMMYYGTFSLNPIN